MIQDPNYVIANSHFSDLRREADRARLARLAAACHTSVVDALLSRFRSDPEQECCA